MIEAGTPAPDFSLLDQHGKAVSLKELKGKPVVLYFYPRDATPGCTTEACDFRDAIAEYEKAGAIVLGVSPDGVSSHQKFAGKLGLPFSLLADAEKEVCQRYGVWQEKTLYGKRSMGVVRTTFLIDSDGIVRKVFPKVRVQGHVAEVLEALRSL
ncbi:thioredoxin-dependent thiol peroxidase [Tautonia sociabilis]|uniref:thioredoxin-dependent peroxiredoxin n=1 Tax=Tautonia sociabilis TaxID=2080755 RepID=A0A432MS00_9BACT|nr:thioredoxin-dependent thiol peroxidase [Tautonia sociabilis]RUL89638.1 thioredoxin-dependent thiol peroxidase [Tautonia sociabilis]